MTAPLPGPPPGHPGAAVGDAVESALDQLKAIDPTDLDALLAAGDQLHCVLQGRLGDLRGD